MRAKSGFSLALFAVLGCSPHVGPRQGACDLNGPSGPGSTGTGHYGASAASTALAAAKCEASTGNACDDCQLQHCCASFSACVGDSVCACADLAMDQCLDSAQESSPDEQPQLVSQCWDSFSASGSVERARVLCQRAWCQSECQTP